MLEIIKGKTMEDLNMIPITSFLPKTGLKPGEFDINKEKYVRDKLKEDPDFECWDFLKYASYKQGFCIYSNHVLVSNTGKIAYELADGTHINSGTLSGKYLQAHIDPTLTNTYINIYLHRAVACTYLAIPERYKELGEGKLEVNHLDGVKTNPHFLNLEWGTKSDNLKHAVANGLIKSGIDDPKTKPMVGEVIVDIDIKGVSFIISGRKEIVDKGLDPMTIYSAARGKTEIGYGCKWRYATPEDTNMNKGFPERLLDIIKNDKVLLNKDLKPLLGEIIDGVNKGLQFVLLGGQEVKAMGFQQAHISRVCSGVLKTHGGCKWKYIPVKDIPNYQRGLSEEQLGSIK
ncbi:hypothetical protein D5W64_13110 [Salmonella enterica subsp. enterica serovar Saintpaul]|nr:hypothetical protein [Salmonella enterica subsp. enterica serovar Saintpaul]